MDKDEGIFYSSIKLYPNNKNFKYSYSYLPGVKIKTEINLQTFLNEIEEVCKKHNISIGHEDCHGSFLFKTYEQKFMDWFKDGYIDENAPW